MDVKIMKLCNDAVMPVYGSAEAAGADLYMLDRGDVTIAPHKTEMIHTGLIIELPQGYAGLIYARSGIATKRGLAPANKVGVIDSDYRGEVMVAIHNHSDEPQTLSSGERIAQLVIAPVVQANFMLCDSLTDTERGEGGFGSTGKK